MPLRICLISPEYIGYGRSFERALTSLGHQVTTHFFGGYDADRTVAKRARDLAVHELLPRSGLTGVVAAIDRRFNQSVEASVRRERPDVVLVVNGDVLEPSLVDELGSLAPTVCWAFDSPYRFDKTVQAFGSYMLIACFSRSDAARVRDQGFNGVYLPMGYDPLMFGPPSHWTADTTAAVSFVGARYDSRVQLFTTLAQAVDLGIWGGAWKPKPWRPAYYRRRTALDRCCRGDADRRAANAIYQNSKICLNAHGPWDGLNPRVFEIPGAGGLQLCDEQPGLEEMFDVGTEVETFGSPEECLEKVRFYLADDGARRRIAEAGQQRARREHKIEDRLRSLLAQVRLLGV